MAENAVQLKLPTFWPTQASTWFIQAEAQFQLRNISADETKYYHVIASFDQETAARLSDLLETPPEADKYKNIKKRILEIFSLSDNERATRLLHMSGLGDRKPSQLMEEMLHLHGNRPICYLFKAIFLQQLPTTVRAQLVSNDFTNPRETALLADNIWQSIDRSQVTVVTKRTVVPSTSRSISEKPPVSGLCYFHRRFGKTAYRCQSPCAFQGNGSSDHQK
jgi:hypothetical protein